MVINDFFQRASMCSPISQQKLVSPYRGSLIEITSNVKTTSTTIILSNLDTEYFRAGRSYFVCPS